MTAVSKKIALIGQPNVGKSVVFGCLTGTYATVSNYPGTTVEVSRGDTKIGKYACEIIDTPGLYSIFPITEEERCALKIINSETCDLILHVIDAKNLERMLPLTFQLQLTGIPIVIAINMFDEAGMLGITIDTTQLAQKIGIPVVATVAINNQGINQLFTAMNEQLSAQRFKLADLPHFSDRLMKEWYKKSADICRMVIKKREKTKKFSRIDRMIMSPLSGGIILALVLYLGLYKFVGVFGAGVVVNFLEGIFIDYINPWLSLLADKHIPWPAVRHLFVGEYGILTLGIRYAIAIVLPIVGLFFFVFAIIEDSGYLPRLSFLLDRAFKKIGLSGRAVIPMILGLGCATMGTMVTRTLPTRRERVIATLLLSLCIPCSAQLGVILGLLGGTPNVLVAWFIIIVCIFGAVGALLSAFVPGSKPSFIVEIPPLRIPQIKNVLGKTFARMKWYFMEIIPLFILASFLIWLGQLFGIFDRMVKAISIPLSAMGLPSSSAPAFIFGFFRRDYGAAGLYDLHRAKTFTNNQLLIAVVVLTLFLPCITQFLITIKERGWKIGVGISLFVLSVAFLVGIVLNFAVTNMNITF